MVTNKTLRIATRQSPLALWQANAVRAQLLHHWPQKNIELLPMTTSGDAFLKDKLQSLGGKGLFVKELEEALLSKRADLAVHSVKDMPTTLPPGLILGAICKRGNPFDALVSRKFNSIQDLPQQSTVGTTSLRRQSQLLAYRPDLNIKPLRGNIQTRLKRLEQGEFDAIVLAMAGLERMNLTSDVKSIFNEEMMLPACGQGALCIECREEDQDTQALIAPLHDKDSAFCIETERSVNQALGGNCHTSLAVFCTILDAEHFCLRAKVLKNDGSQCLYDRQSGSIHQMKILTEQCVKNLLDAGAASFLSCNS